MYGAVPPASVTVAVPVAAAHPGCTIFNTWVNAAGSVNITVAVVVQLLAASTVTI